MKSDRQTTINLCLFVAMFLAVSCSSSNQQGPPGAQQVQSYPVLEIQPQSIELTASYPATLEGLQTVEIRPRVQGYIVEMPVDEGDIVEEGQVLFRLNSEQYEQEVRSAEADVEAAKAAVETAKDEVERMSSLAQKEIISDYRLQSAKNQLQSQEAALSQAQAALENARVNLSYTYVKSPTDGVIGSIPYRIGSLVSSTISRPLTVVSDISEVYAYFSMSERELLTMSQSVAGDGGNKTLQQRITDMPDVNLVLADNTVYNHQGTLRLASGLIDTETGSASFRALFPNPKEILRSGGTGSVQIPYQRNSAIVIPKSATYEIQNKRFVYAVTDSNTIESTEVSTLPLSSKQFFVVEEGLAAGNRIVTGGMGSMQNGMTIKPQPVDNDSLYQALAVQDQ
ncbi:efflux RND transporter periplasmic adaptor subunit [Aliifodinibius sp. S!AR15-10]|uniref:efflux RND transporter periplasmic adaptor subunit n=1 Tax=Aliifodinibius sp. S!AR15-10 TaxID=2950437 RepID=UPI00285CD164|nr:efflux RND transporter periplasmic adaptor subunit [Aliifodinibius sp. S!AR15-10]MDR8394029.1 efflux RND transporter periplasmic adaptor subunit [Aliifodinibius sp. S!AR15-10]